MKTYVIKYTFKNNNQTCSFLFHDGEYFGDYNNVSHAAKFPQKISYWRSEWKKQLKGLKNIQVSELDNIPFEFLKELENIDFKIRKYDDSAFFEQHYRGKQNNKSVGFLYNSIMRNSYEKLIDILLHYMTTQYKPETIDCKPLRIVNPHITDDNSDSIPTEQKD